MTSGGYGGWGVQWESSIEKRYDASEFSSLSFWVKGRSGNETFQIGIKDTHGEEYKIETSELTIISTDWVKITIQFEDVTKIDFASLANINFGFNASHGEGTIFIDDISFEP